MIPRLTALALAATLACAGKMRARQASALRIDASSAPVAKIISLAEPMA